MRTSFIAGNWKMHKTRAEAAAAAVQIAAACRSITHRVMIAPSFTALTAVKEALKGSKIILGAQNMAGALQGAHTGEVSALMLKDTGVDIVILGHSERRHVYGETDSLINTKVKLALEQGLEVILCVGELLAEREQGVTEAVVKRQLELGLEGVEAQALGRVTIAYEPVWAIGTGKTATPQDADTVHKYIRVVLEKIFSKTIAEKMIIQYGGSVKPDNIKGLMGMENIDGALVGGASLKPEDFLPIIKYNS